MFNAMSHWSPLGALDSVAPSILVPHLEFPVYLVALFCGDTAALDQQSRNSSHVVDFGLNQLNALNLGLGFS